MIDIAATTLTGNSSILNSSSATDGMAPMLPNAQTELVGESGCSRWRDVGVPDCGGSSEPCEKSHEPAVGGLGLHKIAAHRKMISAQFFGVRIRCSDVLRSDLCKAVLLRRSSQAEWTVEDWQAAMQTLKSMRCWGSTEHGGFRGWRYQQPIRTDDTHHLRFRCKHKSSPDMHDKYCARKWRRLALRDDKSGGDGRCVKHVKQHELNNEADMREVAVLENCRTNKWHCKWCS